MIKKFNQYNESLRDKMEPKFSKEEIENKLSEKFKRLNNYSVDDAYKLADDLKKLGVDIEFYLDYTLLTRDDVDYLFSEPYLVKPFKVMHKLSAIAIAPTEECANNIISVLSNNLLIKEKFEIKKSEIDTNLTIHEAIDLKEMLENDKEI